MFAFDKAEVRFLFENRIAAKIFPQAILVQLQTDIYLSYKSSR